MKLVITGAAGFIGSNYLRHVLANHDDEIVIFDALTYAGDVRTIQDLIDTSQVQFVHGDIIDRDAVSAAMTGADAVIH
ncbi:MAG: NAD-dependent epimerase/dehydratase family protein, partial [Acidimicrobiales bacterium]